MTAKAIRRHAHSIMAFIAKSLYIAKKVFKCDHLKFGKIVIKEGEFKHPRNLERIKREVNLLQSIDSDYFPKNYSFIIDEKNKKFLILEEYIESKKIFELKGPVNF